MRSLLLLCYDALHYIIKTRHEKEGIGRHMFSTEILSILFGLLSALSWGTGDFSGGLATRRSNVYVVVIVSQLVGVMTLIIWAVVSAEAWPDMYDLIWGGAAGLAGAVGLLALYQGLAQGRMGVVAPLTAVMAAALPVVYGAFTLGFPGASQQGGFVLALIAVWLISREQETHPLHTANAFATDLRLAIIAGSGFGVFFILIGRASETAVLWPLVSARIASITTLFAAALVLHQQQLPMRSQLPLIMLAGIFDTGGNVFFALAAQAGRVDIAAILASLYPAATILLARFILHEHIALVQWVGIALALMAVILIAAI